MNLTGYFKALVVDADDPEGRRRVKIRVKGMMDDIPNDYLPWAVYESITAVGKGGSDFKPVKGAKVRVRFAEGDINSPAWSGGIVESKADLPDKQKDGRFILYQSPNKGITITVDENTEDIEIQTKNYNTTLGTLLDKFLAHIHSSGAGPTGLPQDGTTLAPIIIADFLKGTL